MRAIKFLTGILARIFRRKAVPAEQCRLEAYLNTTLGTGTKLTTAQAIVKAEVYGFLNSNMTCIVNGPRRSGKTHLAHMIHRERGGIVVTRSHGAACDFRRNHRRMFGEDGNVVTVEGLHHAVRGLRGATVVMDVSGSQYRANRHVAATNRVVRLRECNRVGWVWTMSRDPHTTFGAPYIFSAVPDHWPKQYNDCIDPCDILDGPCVCGVWHVSYDWTEMIDKHGLTE